MDVRDSQNNIGRAGSYGRDEGDIGGRRQLTETQQATRQQQRSRFQFEATGSDNELEDELDDNLDEIGDAAKRLKGLGISMGQELETQNSRIDRIGEKATGLDNRMFKNTERVSLRRELFFAFFCSSSLVTQLKRIK